MDRFACQYLAVALACAASMFGCSEGVDPERSVRDRDGSIATDASSDAGLVDAGTRFAISLSTSGCRECPLYDLQFDHTGSVLFNGRGNTRQQGWGGRMVPEALAAELLESIVQADYWELQDVYRDTGDGCSEVEADRPTHTWNVSSGGPAKIVVDYQGCKGVRELEALRELPGLLIDKLGLARYLDM